jgi:hypothetical protein
MSRKNHSFQFLIAEAAILSILPGVSLASSPADERETITKIVLQIQKADYEDDRSALQRLYGELAPFAETKGLASRVLYWRGFALWRKAINGFNDSVEKNELQQDLQQAAEEFEKSASADPSFVDAKIALGSCYGFLAYSMNKKDAAELQALVAKSRQSITEAKAAAPDNPRLLWVLGPI